MYLWLGKSNIGAYMKPDGCPLAIGSGICAGIIRRILLKP
jgi:hypothetical protein